MARLDRWLGTRKWVVVGGNALMLACLAGLVLWPDSGAVWATLMFMGVGFFGASFPVVMAHGRAFLPPHLTGRGVALINLCGIGAAGVMQVLTGRLACGVATGDRDREFGPAKPALSRVVRVLRGFRCGSG